jgi:hypothetical protein
VGRSGHSKSRGLWLDLQEVECGVVDWIGLAQDRDR